MERSETNNRLWAKITQSVPETLTFANELNTFYTRFDVHDFSEQVLELKSDLVARADESLKVSEMDVVRSMVKIRKGKAFGPDKVGPNVL